MSRKWTSVLKIGVPALLVAGLAAGLAGTALAAPKNAAANANAPAKVIAGKVISKAAGSFVIQSGNQTQTTTVIVDQNTQYFQVPRALPPRLPAILGKLFKANDQRNGRGPLQRLLPNDVNALRKLGKTATYADLAIGDRVVVRLQPGTETAKDVLIIKPLPPKDGTVTGTLTGLPTGTNGTGGSLIITPTGTGTTPITLTWDSSTRFDLKGVISFAIGQKATAVYNPAAGNKALIVRITAP